MSEGSGLAGVKVGVAAAMLPAVATSLSAFQGEILEVIEAQAFGTSTEMGEIELRKDVWRLGNISVRQVGQKK